MSDQEFRDAYRDTVVGKEEAVLSCVKLVVSTEGVFSIVIEQIDRNNLTNFLNDVDATLYDEIMTTFDKFNSATADINNSFMWVDKEE